MIPTPKFKIGQRVYIKNDVDNFIERKKRSKLNYEALKYLKPNTVTIIGVLLVEDHPDNFQVNYKLSQIDEWLLEASLTDRIE